MPIPLGILAVAGAGAGGAGAFDLLETTVLGTAAATVTFSSLGSYSDYKHLQLRIVLRGDRVSTVGDSRIRLNADSGANYARHNLQGDPPDVISQGNASANYIRVGTFAASQAPSDVFGVHCIDILDFNNTSKNTTVRSLSGVMGSTGNVGLFSGFWNNTAAITSILIYPETDNWVSGSRFSLYGVK